MDEYSKSETQGDGGQPQQPSGHPSIVQQFAKYPGAPDQQPVQSSPPLGSSQSSKFGHALSPNKNNRQSASGSLEPSPRGPRSSLMAEHRSLSTTSMSPPISIASQERHLERHPSREPPRCLPSRDITQSSFDDAYLEFIMYCNPVIPIATDTAELRRALWSPPKSEGKSFSTYTLWELIQKFDRKEIKTWVQLASELGVEPPSLQKKQSTQKVQQYAVRLKRWMRAMHIDAFFEYCLGHEHPYYTQLHPSGDQDEESRDGVPREEDLALRALVPGWKPKRGRKRADESSLDQQKSAKRLHLFTSNSDVGSNSASPDYPEKISYNASPWSAFSEDAERPNNWVADRIGQTQTDAPRPIATTTDRAANNLQNNSAKWKFPQGQQSPPFQYPQSAITPRHPDLDAVFPNNEPQSAITPSSTEKAFYKRRGRPNVSSAWLKPTTSPGKSRGRPVSTAKHYYASFDNGANSEPFDNSSLKATTNSSLLSETYSHPYSANTHSTPGFYQGSTRPTKLQLQVPKTNGAPVQLATQPMVLVNGQNGHSPSSEIPQMARQISVERETANRNHNDKTPSVSPSFTLKDVVEAFASQIQNRDLQGRTTPLGAIESRAIAHSVLRQVKSQCRPDISSDTLSAYCAMCLGVGHKLGLGCKPPERVSIKVSSDTIDNRVSDVGPSTLSHSTTETSFVNGLIGAQYILNYDFASSPGVMTHSTLLATISSQDLIMDRDDSSISQNNIGGRDENQQEDDIFSDELDIPLTELDWKQRYLNLRKHIRKKEIATQKYKKQILEAVMTDI